MPVSKSAASMKCTEQLLAHFKGSDGEGNAVDPNSVIWTSSDETVATLVPAPDGLSCHVVGGVPGECNVVANATAQGGKKAVIAVLALTVTVGEVDAGEITTDPPVAQGDAIDNGLPSRPPRPGNALPGIPGVGIGGQLPVPPGAHADIGLPNAPVRPGQGLPETPEPKR